MAGSIVQRTVVLAWRQEGPMDDNKKQDTKVEEQKPEQELDEKELEKVSGGADPKVVKPWGLVVGSQ
jgi:bacteriocin-like protein